VNDAGFELIERDGKYRVEGKGKETATMLHKDDIVHTHAQSKRILSSIQEQQQLNAWMDSLLTGTGVMRAAEDRQTQRLTAAIVSTAINERSLTRAFNSALKNLPLSVQVWDEKGHRQYETRMNSKVNHMNERNKLGGNG
jgi:hypothetical protein